MRPTCRELGTALLAGTVAIAVAACAGTEMKQEPAAQAKTAAVAEVKKEAAAYKKPRGKEFVNPSPAFSVIYPRYVENKPLGVETEVLRLADKSGLPTFVAAVYEYTGGALKDMAQGFFEGFKTDPRYSDKTGWALEYQKMTELPDGTPALALEVGWDWTPGFRLYTTYVVVIHGDKTINYNVTSTEKGNKSLKKYLYSLTLK